MAVKAIPDNYRGAVPYLHVTGAARAIEFYKNAFGATERMRMGDGPRIGHAEITIGDALIMLADEYPEIGVRSPQSIGGTAVTIHLYFDDVDAVAARAVDAGATILRPVENQFYGDRGGKLRDPFGHEWWIATHVEDVA